ncbi:MAG TPA: AMP-binding protein [Stellaceae bacterium]|nr:AMP-binding protein [Stellaceae bacterium]
MFVGSIRRAVQIRGDALATVYGDRERSWRESAGRTARLAAALGKLGIGPGQSVGILSANSDRFLEAVHAIWWAGAVVVPMNVRWAVPEHVYSVGDASIDLIFADPSFAATAQAIAAECPRVRHLVQMGDEQPPEGWFDFEALIEAASPIPAYGQSDDALAGVFYTGGTTGTPKGVMHSARSIASTSLTLYWTMRVPEAVRYLHASPMFHLGGMTPGFATTLVAGTHVFVPAFRPELVFAAVRRHRVQFSAMVPTMIQTLVDHPDFRAADFASFEVLQYGGGAITERVRLAAEAALPNARLEQGFGQTECAGGATLLPHAVFQALAADDPKRRSAGRAAFGVEVRIVGPEDAPLSAGEVGEICLRTPGAMLGYLNRPEETARTLRGGWLHTGDAGYLDADGYLFVVDRVKDVIRTGGENVFSAEVENAVGSHPAVASVAAIAVPDDKWGERVHVVVVPKPGCTVTLEELQAHCRALIAGYKIPRSFETRDSLPTSPQHKILKSELRKPHWAGRERKIG